MTDLDILKHVSDTLDKISVPVAYTDQIAAPIKECSDLIKKLYDAVVENVRKMKEERERMAAETAEVSTNDGNDGTEQSGAE